MLDKLWRKDSDMEAHTRMVRSMLDNGTVCCDWSESWRFSHGSKMVHQSVWATWVFCTDYPKQKRLIQTINCSCSPTKKRMWNPCWILPSLWCWTRSEDLGLWPLDESHHPALLLLIVCSPTDVENTPPLTSEAAFRIWREYDGVLVPMPRRLLESSHTNCEDAPNSPPLLYWIWWSLPAGTTLAST